MAGQTIQVQSTLKILNGNQSYQALPSAFQAVQNGNRGPVPGYLTVDETGSDIDLSAIGIPGMYRIANIDDPTTATAYLIYGINNGTLFYPLGEVQPGETYVGRLFRYIGEDFANVGTGTSGPINFLHLRAVKTGSVAGTVGAKLEVFEA